MFLGENQGLKSRLLFLISGFYLKSKLIMKSVKNQPILSAQMYFLTSFFRKFIVPGMCSFASDPILRLE